MPYSKQLPYAVAIREMNYWKNTVQNQNRGDPEPWNDNSGRSFRSPSYDSGMDGRWQNDRMDMGRNGPPPLFGSRPGTHLSSSNQINSNLFGNYQPRNDFSFRGGGMYNSGNSGRINKNSLVEFTRAKRILQKRALNAVGSSTLNNSTLKRKRGPRIRKPQETTKDGKNDSTAGKTEDGKPVKNEKVSADLRLAIIWVNDHKANITGEQSQILQKKLEALLDELPISEDDHIPKFFASGLSAGIYKIVCTDEKSAEWLKEAVAKCTDLWDGAKFDVIKQAELNSLHHVTILLTHNDEAIINILKKVEKQNPEVKTEKWRVHREVTEEHKRTIVFGIDQESLEYLKKHEWKLFCGLRQIKFTQGISIVKPAPLLK